MDNTHAEHHQLERMEKKLDRIDERLARIEGAVERHDERTMNNHARILALELQQRKATWALIAAMFSLIGTLIGFIR